MNPSQYKPKILVVDDTDFVASLLRQSTLSKAELHFERNGRQALEYVQHHHPDLVLIQLMLSEMDSMEICSRIKNNCNHHPKVVIVAQNNYRKSLVDLCSKCGADKTLFTPIDQDILESVVLRDTSTYYKDCS